MTPDQSGEIEAFIPQLRRYARTLVRNTVGADDLVQDCLERAIQRFEQFESGTNMRAWLFTIMHSIFVNQWRRRARQGTEVDLEDWTEGNHCKPPQEDHMAIRDVEYAMASLPDDSRTILMLVAIEGFSYEEAADVLDIPMGTVRSRLSRAREMLARKLGAADPSSQREIQPSTPAISSWVRRVA